MDNNILLDVCDEELFTTSGGPIFLFFGGGGEGSGFTAFNLGRFTLYLLCALSW